MHEVSVAQSMLAIAEDYARREGATSISVIGLRIGEFSGVVAEALERAFDMVKQGTLAQEARLQMEITPLTAYCQRCKQDFNVANPYAIARCPDCTSVSHDFRQGQELDLSFLEVS